MNDFKCIYMYMRYFDLIVHIDENSSQKLNVSAFFILQMSEAEYHTTMVSYNHEIVKW